MKKKLYYIHDQLYQEQKWRGGVSFEKCILYFHIFLDLEFPIHPTVRIHTLTHHNSPFNPNSTLLRQMGAKSNMWYTTKLNNIFPCRITNTTHYGNTQPYTPQWPLLPQ